MAGDAGRSPKKEMNDKRHEDKKHRKVGIFYNSVEYLYTYIIMCAWIPTNHPNDRAADPERFR